MDTNTTAYETEPVKLDVDAIQSQVTRFWESPSLVKAVNTEEREVLHLISTQSRDRAGDVVEPKGAVLKNYKQNPVVLANHDYQIESILGRSVMIDATEEGLWTRTKFRDTPLAEAAFRLTAEKLGGWSIGFRPMKHHSIKQGKDEKCKVCSEIFEALAEGKEPGDWVPGAWGMHFRQWELLEYSSVAIPMNQDIVNNAVQRGLVTERHAPLFFRSEPSPAPPPADVADASDGSNAEPVSQPIDTTPAERAISAALRSIRLVDVAQRINKTEM